MRQSVQPGTGVGLGPVVMGAMVTICVVIFCPGEQPYSPRTHVCVRGIVQVAVVSDHGCLVESMTSVTGPLRQSRPRQSVTMYVLVL